MERIVEFLELIRKGSFSNGRPPKVWSAEYREALSADMVRIGWGGRIELTDAGRENIKRGADKDTNSPDDRESGSSGSARGATRQP